MTRSLVYSTVLHILLISVLLLINFQSREKTVISQTVRLRISGAVGRISQPKELAASPSDASRQSPSKPIIPTPQDTAGVFETGSVVRESRSILPLASRNTQVLPATIAVGSHRNPENLDPLAGLESFAAPSDDPGTSNRDRWSISWENGRERGIVKVPVIDENAVPNTAERLSSVVVRIEVSPQGNVVAAEIEEPGSGDIRIDRYIHGKALDFVFENILEQEGVQRGFFRLFFSDPGAQ